MRVGVDLQLLDRDLTGHGVHALPHLRPAVPDLDGAVLLEPHDRARDLLEAVAEARVLEPEAEPDGGSRGDCVVVGRLDRVEARTRAEAAVVHDLTGSPHRARGHDVARTDLPA